MLEKGHIKEYSEKISTYNGLKGILLKDRQDDLKDKNLLFFHDRIIRIVSVIYLLTGLLDSAEPVRNSLRKSALELLESSLSLEKEVLKSSKKRCLEFWRSDALKVSSILEMSFLSGLISEMNFRILKNEMEKLFNLAVSCTEYLEVGEPEINSVLGDLGGLNLESKSANQSRGLNYTAGERQVEKLSRQNFADSMHSKPEDVLRQSANKEKKDRKSKRQLRIIDVIKDTKVASIKDISDNIKDCSEKTIQRELISMVKSGVLKKDGERRWSRYSLNL